MAEEINDILFKPAPSVFSDEDLYDEYQKEFDQEYKDFRKKNTELQYYAIIYPEL